MKHSRLIGLVALLFLAATPAFARSQAKPDVQAALIEWKEAVESGSVDAIMKLYDRDAIMISTFAQIPMTKRQQLVDFYKKVVVNPDIKVDIDTSHPRSFGTFAVNSGRYTLSYAQEGERISVPARFTFVYQLQGDKWVIVDQHSSRVPLPEETE